MVTVSKQSVVSWIGLIGVRTLARSLPVRMLPSRNQNDPPIGRHVAMHLSFKSQGLCCSVALRLWLAAVVWRAYEMHDRGRGVTAQRHCSSAAASCWQAYCQQPCIFLHAVGQSGSWGLLALLEASPDVEGGAARLEQPAAVCICWTGWGAAEACTNQTKQHIGGEPASQLLCWAWSSGCSSTGSNLHGCHQLQMVFAW